jgi:FkbM family methyltransferase
VWVRGLRLRVPHDQLPEAWLNIVHAICLGDYWVVGSFHPRPGWSVVDVGAYLGFYTVYAAVYVGPRGRVVAVEPNPWARSYLYENAVLNRVDDRVEVDPRAAGSRTGYATLYVPPFWGNSSLVKEYAEAYGDTVEVLVRVERLSTIMEDHNLARADLVKIDVEGLEQEVLRDALRLARRVVVELHPPYTGPSTVRGAGRCTIYHLATGQLVAYLDGTQTVTG